MEQMELIPAITESKNIIIKFDTAQHVFDAETMGKTLLAFNSTILTFSKMSNASNVRLDVSTISPGCIELGAIISAISNAGAKIEFLKVIYGYIKDLCDLYLFLKGKAPKKIEPVNNGQYVENHFGEHATFNNSVVNVYNVLQTSPLGDMDRLSYTPGLKGIQILDEKRQTIVDVKKEDFPKFIPHNKTLNKEENITEEQEVELHLSTINLLNDNKDWNFIFNETSVKAKIIDEIFLKRIQYGLSFRRGDRIRAIWKLYKKFDVATDCHLIKKREIVSVLEYIPRQDVEQGTLL